MKILFLLKKDDGYGYGGPKSGLTNSSKFLLDALLSNKIFSSGFITICDDGNGVDKAVSDTKPDICIIEALWVTPEKLDENIKLHPKTRFIVRVHSNIPFLAMEGIAIDWIRRYPEVAFNSSRTAGYLRGIINPLYLPNIDTKEEIKSNNGPRTSVFVGCFGSIRPLKNQLIQAIAAVSYGDKYNKEIFFYINAQRVEMGDNVLKNIRALFANTRHTLIEVGWLDYNTFISLVRIMDVGLQVSYTESFNIVSADFVHVGVPVIVSPDISWQDVRLQVDPNNADAITSKIYDVLRKKGKFIRRQSRALSSYNTAAIKVWKAFK